MAVNVRSGDLDQLFLMPPSVKDWLPEDHLAFFVLDVVSELDLAAFYAAYRADGRGGSVYDPVMMLGVLFYAYCTGERSSRRIERRLVEDVAYRVLAVNQSPDHATLDPVPAASSRRDCWAVRPGAGVVREGRSGGCGRGRDRWDEDRC